MSEEEEGRPLTRRELRLREMAEAGQSTEAPAVQVEAPPAEPALGEEEPDISPLHPDGTPRTRREMRELRELALAEREEISLEQTQAFTRADFEEAMAAAPEASEADAAGGEAPEVDLTEVEIDTAEVDTAEVIEDVENLEAEASAEEAESEADGEPEKDAYSFPDIAPLDEGGSVFDDPAVRRAPEPAQAGGDFDDLISRAVAQEGAASTSNTSALILPDMGHTGQLAGPLGETGELFITGSIDLPKSLGETGGHAALLDSVQSDPDELHLGERKTDGDSGLIAPVAASQAVSARSTSASVVATPVKEKSKLPAVLIATGGGLIVVIVGLAIWAASSGLFA